MLHFDPALNPFNHQLKALTRPDAVQKPKNQEGHIFLLEVSILKHGKLWSIVHGIKALALSALTLGVGVLFSQYVQNEWRQALTSQERKYKWKEVLSPPKNLISENASKGPENEKKELRELKKYLSDLNSPLLPKNKAAKWFSLALKHELVNSQNLHFFANMEKLDLSTAHFPMDQTFLETILSHCPHIKNFELRCTSPNAFITEFIQTKFFGKLSSIGVLRYIVTYSQGNLPIKIVHTNIDIYPYLQKSEIFQLHQALKCDKERDLSEDSKTKFVQIKKEILSSSFSFNGIPVFKDNAKLEPLFAISEQKSSVTLTDYLSKMGKHQTKELMRDLTENYTQFLKWLKLVGEQEAKVTDPKIRAKFLQKKSVLMEWMYERHMNLIREILVGYPQLFQNKLLLLYNTSLAPYKILFMPDGMQLLVDRIQAEEELDAESASKYVICNSYTDYKKRLEETVDQPDGEWYFIFRCAKENNKGVHQSLVILNKKAGKSQVFLLDSGGFEALFADGNYIASLTREVLAKADIQSTLYLRQKDQSNCGFFVINDCKTVRKTKRQAIRDMQTSLQKPDKKKKKNPYSFQLNKNPKKTVKIGVQLTDQISPSLMKSMQSLSVLNETIKTLQSIKKPNSKTKAVVNKLQKVRQTYTAFDFKINKEVYLYTTMKGIKYRLQIIERAFSNY